MLLFYTFYTGLHTSCHMVAYLLCSDMGNYVAWTEVLNFAIYFCGVVSSALFDDFQQKSTGPGG